MHAYLILSRLPIGRVLRHSLPWPADPAAPPLIDAWSALYPRDPHPATSRLHDAEPGETPYCCDFVFVREDLLPRLAALRIVADTLASDLQPLVVELRS